jgi:hypothetical protein
MASCPSWRAARTLILRSGTSKAEGKFVYLPEALAIHWDQALDIRSYYRRTLFAAQCSVRLGRHHPTLACRDQARVNGPLSRQDTLRQVAKKLTKYVLGCRPFVDALLIWTNWVERCTRGGWLLDAHYSLRIGIVWLHGYRRGLANEVSEVAKATGTSTRTTCGRQK